MPLRLNAMLSLCFAALCETAAIRFVSLPYQFISSPSLVVSVPCLSFSFPCNAFPLLRISGIRCSIQGSAVPPQFRSSLRFAYADYFVAIPLQIKSALRSAYAVQLMAIPLPVISVRYASFPLLCSALHIHAMPSRIIQRSHT